MSGSGLNLGLQIGTQFCPVLTIGNGLRDGRQGWVFLWAEICVNRWFFDIYIQGSKYNFLELSLRQDRSEERLDVERRLAFL